VKFNIGRFNQTLLDISDFQNCYIVIEPSLREAVNLLYMETIKLLRIF
jgi:hypothetical protein